MIHDEIVDRAVEPGLRLAHLAELRVKFHKRFLNDVLRDTHIPEQPPGVSQKWRFQGMEDFLNGSPLQSRRVWVVGSFHLHRNPGGEIIGITQYGSAFDGSR